MTERDAFLQSIIENPADDAPRLIFADWLEEQGESERAEFIRVQCEFERLTEPDGTCPFLDDYGRSPPRWAEGICQCRGCRLHRRERKLLCNNFDKWHNLPNDPHGRVWDMQNFDDDDPEPEAQFRALFRRGFVSSVTLPCSSWRTHGERLLRAAPLERVTLTQCRIGSPEWDFTADQIRPVSVYPAENGEADRDIYTIPLVVKSSRLFVADGVFTVGKKLRLCRWRCWTC